MFVKSWVIHVDLNGFTPTQEPLHQAHLQLWAQVLVVMRTLYAMH